MFFYQLYNILAIFFLTFMIFLYISEITIWYQFCLTCVREVPGTPTASNMEPFVTLRNGLKPLINGTKNSILDVAGVLDTPLNEALSVGEISSPHGE